ncbi:hypothetical protein [Faecalibacter macacae]|uniref:DUF922 domain-containing protein n=1 Tax=Faecalibacter macacae TaxID=1859289 RepID=A0A3L9M810_9FLAO|nr:hypothetical protein [Faecalibacter macacae]RLZ09165.1 hypothetical protein EAH69_09140 [Faecalibacter macacae]
MISYIYLLAINISPFIFSLNQNKNDGLIDWSENRKLTFSDFKAKPKTSKGVEGELSTKITWTVREETGKLPEYKIYNKMNPYESWVSIKHEELLKEYQFLWNLSELYTRKTRKEIEALKFKKVKNKEQYKSIIVKNVQKFQTERQKFKGTLHNQPDLYKILNNQYQDSLKIYSKYAR